MKKLKFRPIHDLLRNKVTILYPKKYTAEFCTTETVCQIADCIEELEAIFKVNPNIVMKNYNLLDAEFLAMTRMIESMKGRKGIK